MLSSSVPRFLLQAGLLIAVAAVAAILHLHPWAIVTVMAAAFAAVVAAEWLAGREPVGRMGRVEPSRRPAALVPAEAPLRRFPPRLRPTPAAAPAAPLRKPPAALPPFPTWPRAEPPPQPPASRPPASALPASCLAAPPVAERRQWNVFDLQNRARQIVGADPARDEQLSFLLLYLRELAGVSGDLPEDFDPFVRESFPELVALS